MELFIKEGSICDCYLCLGVASGTFHPIRLQDSSIAGFFDSRILEGINCYLRFLYGDGRQVKLVSKTINLIV